MASESARAVLNEVAETLAETRTPFAVIGGLALAAWSHPRATRDVDLLIGVDQEHVQPVIDRLLSVGCRPKKVPPLNRVGSHSFVHLLYTPPDEVYDVQFDLLLAESEFERSALARSVVRSVAGVEKPLRIINCDDLILLKLVSGRLIDRADAAMLLRENRAQLDFPHIDRWLAQLGLTDEYREIWREAFPDEPPPPTI